MICDSFVVCWAWFWAQVGFVISWAIGDGDSAGGILVGGNYWRGCSACIFKGTVVLHGWDCGMLVALALGGNIGRGEGHWHEEAQWALTIGLV